MDQTFISVRDFCRQIGICKTTFWNWEKQGIAPPVARINRRPVIRTSVLEDWLKSHERDTAA